MGVLYPFTYNTPERVKRLQKKIKIFYKIKFTKKSGLQVKEILSLQSRQADLFAFAEHWLNLNSVQCFFKRRCNHLHIGNK